MEKRTESLALILCICFGTGALWDAITTFLGIIDIIGISYGNYGVALVGAFLVFGINLNTEKIWKPFWDALGFLRGYRKKDATEDLVVPLGLGTIWALCIIFDFITSFQGNFKLLPDEKKGNAIALLVIIIITLLTTISPMMLSYYIGEYMKNKTDKIKL
jgi:hypothetical protein